MANANNNQGVLPEYNPFFAGVFHAAFFLAIAYSAHTVAGILFSGVISNLIGFLLPLAAYGLISKTVFVSLLDNSEAIINNQITRERFRFAGPGTTIIGPWHDKPDSAGNVRSYEKAGVSFSAFVTGRDSLTIEGDSRVIWEPDTTMILVYDSYGDPENVKMAVEGYFKAALDTVISSAMIEGRKRINSVDFLEKEEAVRDDYYNFVTSDLFLSELRETFGIRLVKAFKLRLNYSKESLDSLNDQSKTNLAIDTDRRLNDVMAQDARRELGPDARAEDYIRLLQIKLAASKTAGQITEDGRSYHISGISPDSIGAAVGGIVTNITNAVKGNSKREDK